MQAENAFLPSPPLSAAGSGVVGWVQGLQHVVTVLPAASCCYFYYQVKDAQSIVRFSFV